MSAIQRELTQAAGINPEKYNDRAALHAAVVKAVNGLSEKDWGQLTVPAQDWFNAAADAHKAKKPLMEFPDFQIEPETRRRRASTDDDGGKNERMGVADVKEGARVKITTKRGKVFQGLCVENNQKKEFIAIKDAQGGEDEIDWEKVDLCETFHGNGQDSDPGPEVGDEVEFTTKRGRKVSGVISELTGETIILGKDDDYDMDRIDGDIKIVKKGNGRAPEPETRRRGSTGSDEGSEKQGRSGNPRGTSVGGRIRELLAKDLSMSKDETRAALKKDGIEFRDATLDIIYRDTTSFIQLLRDNEHLKKK